MAEDERFYIKESILKESSVIQDKEHKYSFPILQNTMNFMFNKALNELNDECDFLAIENESLEDGAMRYAELYHKALKENEQLKTQINIFEKFLDENNLDIDWEIFCTVDECKKDSDDYGCKECKYLGDVE